MVFSMAREMAEEKRKAIPKSQQKCYGYGSTSVLETVVRIMCQSLYKTEGADRPKKKKRQNYTTENKNILISKK